MEMMGIFWAIVIGFALIIEIITPSKLVSIWFSIGGVAALIIACLHGNIWIQIIAFLGLSIAFLVVCRPFVNRYVRVNRIATNADRCIGEIATVVETIDDDHWGQVKVNGVIWSAISINKEMIKPNDKVKVVSIDGAKLLVKKI